MKHISESINEILTEWAYRVHDGMPNPKNQYHLVQLQESMKFLKVEIYTIPLDTKYVACRKIMRHTCISFHDHTLYAKNELQNNVNVLKYK